MNLKRLISKPVNSFRKANQRPVIWWIGGVGALGLACLGLYSCPRQPPSTPAPQRIERVAAATPEKRAELERLVFLFTNRMRSQRGLIPLRGDATLAEIARNHSEDMLQRQYFQHDSPEGATPEQRIHRSHRTLVGITGENLWSGTGYAFESSQDVARLIVDSWMASRGHRNNLLHPEFTHLGVGIAMTPEGQIRATQNFAHAVAYLRRSLPIRLPPANPYNLTLDDLDLSNELDAGPSHFAFEDGDPPGKPAPLGTLKTPDRQGHYQLRLYFPQAKTNSLLTFPGPIFEVR